jgi:DNA-binding response OmpR family regulator
MKKLSDISALVIEDDKVVLDLISNYLKKRVKHIYQSVDAEEGLAIALNSNPDIIITDLELPKMNGLDMIVELRNRQRYEKPIIVVTGHEEGRYYPSLADEYIYKPVDFGKLIDSMCRLLCIEG